MTKNEPTHLRRLEKRESGRAPMTTALVRGEQVAAVARRHRLTKADRRAATLMAIYMLLVAIERDRELATPLKETGDDGSEWRTKAASNQKRVKMLMRRIHITSRERAAVTTGRWDLLNTR